MNPLLAATQTRIERITAQLEMEFGLDGWLDIRHIFDAGHDGDTTLGDDGSSTIYPTTAISTPSWRYRCGKIRWFLNLAAPQSDDDLTLVAIHEYLHLLIAPVTSPVPHKSVAADLEEYAVESIARVIAPRGMTDIH